jgi:hypothetical protein
MTHIVDAMAALQALRASYAPALVSPNPVVQPPAVLHPLAVRPVQIDPAHVQQVKGVRQIVAAM